MGSSIQARLRSDFDVVVPVTLVENGTLNLWLEHNLIELIGGELKNANLGPSSRTDVSCVTACANLTTGCRA